VTGAEHYREGERLLLDASLIDLHGNPVNRDGVLLPPGVHEAMVRRAMAHFAAAQAAALAEAGGLANTGSLGVLSPWGRAIGGDS
jgi:hypothetical protein